MKAYGTRKKPLNTKIEPNLDGSLKSNVVIVPILEPYDKKIVTYEAGIVNTYQKVISILNESTTEYYNMKMALKENSHN